MTARLTVSGPFDEHDIPNHLHRYPRQPNI